MSTALPSSPRWASTPSSTFLLFVGNEAVGFWNDFMDHIRACFGSLYLIYSKQFHGLDYCGDSEARALGISVKVLLDFSCRMGRGPAMRALGQGVRTCLPCL